MRRIAIAIGTWFGLCASALAQTQSSNFSPASPLAVTLGGTWQLLFAANTNRKTLWVENYCSTTTQNIGATESLFIYFLPPSTAAPTTAAGPTLGAFELVACGSQVFSGTYNSTQAVYVLGATTGHAFAAWQTK
jgi:hypothetical protein